jgi:hypothetical protein
MSLMGRGARTYPLIASSGAGTPTMFKTHCGCADRHAHKRRHGRAAGWCSRGIEHQGKAGVAAKFRESGAQRSINGMSPGYASPYPHGFWQPSTTN